jgi:hypothetical protein
VRIDRPDPADDSDDADMASRARPSRDTPDVTDKDPGGELSGGGLSRLSVILPDAPSQVERAKAYCAMVDAVYRQYDIDHGQPQAEENEHGAVPPVTRRIESGAAQYEQND